MTERRYGEGSVYYDEKRERWVGQVELGRDATGRRRRKRVFAESRVGAIAKMRGVQRRKDDLLPIISER